MTTPERVDREVLGMTNDRLFSSTAALATWKKLKANGHVHILSDDLTTVALTEAVTRISGIPAEQRIRSAKSLGEIMVLAVMTMDVVYAARRLIGGRPANAEWPR